MVEKVKNYLSLVKFSHTIFALPFALIGFFLAINYSKDISSGDLLQKLALVIACMVFARSAAMAFNRYLDRHFDALNPRTAIREIPAGVITHRHALAFTVLMCILFIASTFFINRICFYLSPVALFVVLFYSYTKRFTPLCHLVLGLGLSLAPIGAWLAVTGSFNFLPLILSFAVIFWVSGFDIIYALQDVNFDRNHNLRSIPAYLGEERALLVSRILHFVSAVCIFSFGMAGGFGLLFWIGAFVYAGMLVYQHSLVKPDDLRRVNLAFMTANGIASVVFALFVLADIYF